MINEIIYVLWILLPAAFANMAPVLVKKINFLDYPIDFGKKIGKARILGENKTFRGLFFGILFSILIVFVQAMIITENYSLINDNLINFIYAGFLLGFGALFGDLVKSFFKRRLKIVPGKSWIPFDQIDWVVGAIIFYSFYVWIGWNNVILAIILFGILHPLINYIGYLIGIKKNKF